jgi:hypothetical protein
MSEREARDAAGFSSWLRRIADMVDGVDESAFVTMANAAERIAELEAQVEREVEAGHVLADESNAYADRIAQLRAIVEPLRALAAAATPGPLDASAHDDNFIITNGTLGVGWTVTHADAALIVAAINALPALLRLAEPGA